MDETKQRGTFSSSELATAAMEERQAEAKEIAESLAGRSAAEPPKSRYSPITVSPEAGARESSPAGELVGFLKQTKRVWLIAVGGIFGLVLVATLLGRGYEWASYVRQRREERAVASVTPDRLIARCGQPSADDTKEVFPIMMRTMTYQVGSHETYLFSFSRTAEDKSDWVFLSMKDTNSGKSYDTPEEKVAAMSCLDSRR